MNIIYYDSQDIVFKDNYIREILTYGDFTVPYEEVLLTGDRFLEFHLNPSLGSAGPRRSALRAWCVDRSGRKPHEN